MMKIESKLILGTVQMGIPYGVNNLTGKVSANESQAILLEAHLSGIRSLDTAEAYGNAHQIIGDFHRANSGVRFNVTTKIPSNQKPHDLRGKIEGYLEELCVDRLDNVLFHAFDTYRTGSDLMQTLHSLKGEGLIGHIGVSVYTNAQVEDLFEDELVELIQLPFNLLDNASIRGSYMQRAKSKNKTVHSRSAFLQGLFFKDSLDDHPIARQLKHQLNQIREIAILQETSIAKIALAYCLQQPNIDGVLIGVDSLSHLKSNLEACRFVLDQETMARIDSIRTPDLNLLNPSLWN